MSSSTHGQLRLITPPSGEVVTLDEAKKHLRVDDDDDNVLIGIYITAAVEALDGKGGYLSRALLDQSYVLTLDAFPCREAIALKLGPVASITSITYVDPDGDTQSIDSDKFVLARADGYDDATVCPAYGLDWPSTRNEPGAVRIEYVAGYGAAGASLPQSIRNAILLHVGHLYDNRGTDDDDLPPVCKALLRKYRRPKI